MIEPRDHSSADFAATSYKQMLTVAAPIAAALPVYAIIAEVLWRGSAVEPPAYFGTLRIAFFVIAGVMIFTATIVKGVMLRNAPADPLARLARLRTATLTALAMSEVPAIFGLVLVVIGRARPDFYMLLAISAYMMVRHFPRRGAWQDYLARGSASSVR